MTCTNMYMEMELQEGDSFTVAVDIDIHGYPCVDIKLSASMHGNVISVVFELLMTLLSASALTTQISCCY